MTSIFDRPQRANIADAEWRVHAELVREGQVIERSDKPALVYTPRFLSVAPSA